MSVFDRTLGYESSGGFGSHPSFPETHVRSIISTLLIISAVFLAGCIIYLAIAAVADWPPFFKRNFVSASPNIVVTPIFFLTPPTVSSYPHSYLADDVPYPPAFLPLPYYSNSTYVRYGIVISAGAGVPVSVFQYSPWAQLSAENVPAITTITAQIPNNFYIASSSSKTVFTITLLKELGETAQIFSMTDSSTYPPNPSDSVIGNRQIISLVSKSSSTPLSNTAENFTLNFTDGVASTTLWPQL